MLPYPSNESLQTDRAEASLARLLSDRPLAILMKRISDSIASPQEEAEIEDSFCKHEFVLDFSVERPKYLVKVEETQGVYLIAAKGEGLLKCYIGKTTSFRRRLSDYHRKFQVHCPNDRKLAFFQKWLSNESGPWTFMFFTQPYSGDSHGLAQLETFWINRLNPIVNATKKSAVSMERKVEVEEAVQKYFTSFFDECTKKK